MGVEGTPKTAPKTPSTVTGSALPLSKTPPKK